MGHITEPALAAQPQNMREAAREHLSEVDIYDLARRVGSRPARGEDPVHAFIQEEHRKGLAATDLQENEIHAMRDTYAKLLQALPESTERKVPAGQLGTELGRATAITQLIAKHYGEVVELDPLRASWLLVRMAPGPARAYEHQQLWCLDGGFQVRGRTGDYDFGYKATKPGGYWQNSY